MKRYFADLHLEIYVDGGSDDAEEVLTLVRWAALDQPGVDDAWDDGVEEDERELS